MWQIQWVIGLIPTGILVWIYMAILSTGVFLYFGSKLASRWPFKFIPIIGQYAVAAEIIGVVFMTSGIYLYGGYGTEMAWRDRVTKLESRIKISEQQSQDANAKLSTAVREKNKAIQDNKYIVLGKIKQNAVKIDQECRLDPTAVEILNESAKVPKVKK
jgi:hypothetical protein